jgi:hypothetical protein
MLHREEEREVGLKINYTTNLQLPKTKLNLAFTHVRVGKQKTRRHAVLRSVTGCVRR